MTNHEQKIKEEILLYAFRYALSRQTYAVDTVATEIKEQGKNLSLQTIEIIIKEINIAEKGDNLGMEMDKKVWQELRDYLRKYV